jgi:site-specific recombinase XerD
MRHTVGSTLAREGRSAVEIATVLGHKTLEVVKRYSHINVKAKTAIVQNSALSHLK